MSLCQVAVKRAKTQLKSAMMMNLESRFITCEDIGRSASHTEDDALSLSISSSVLYVCVLYRQVLGQNVKYSTDELMEKIGEYNNYSNCRLLEAYIVYLQPRLRLY